MKTIDAVEAFGALAQETRLDVFRLLVKAHDPDPKLGGMAAGEIAARLKLAPATLSFHLKELARAGLLVSRKDGRSIIYRVQFDKVATLASFLLEDCCEGRCGVCVSTAAPAKQSV
ncbi:metalloregulator ArsR/SmtB family transcription factor [Pyruvatibacter sp.]|uniref:ArsR/SmtB family transcription factor n=1 Tax=Pyruvatibacter sp. TaxID=1981328 RepID=UPI0032EF1407